MRVLHVIPSLDERDGGPSVALPLMARGLAMHGVSVEVVTTITAEDARTQGIHLGEPTERQDYTVRFFKRQTSFYKVSLPLLRWLRAHAQHFALVHNHAVFSFAPLAGARSARLAGVPYLIRPLGLLNHWGMEQRRRWIKALSFRLLDKPALNRAAAIHYTSYQEEREAARLKLHARSLVIPLGVDLAAFNQLPDAMDFFSTFPVARGRKIVLFLSRFDRKKGVEVLLDAFARARRDEPNAILVMAGSGAPGYEAELKAMAASIGLGTNVLWTGFLSGADKLAALSAADLFVLPSYSENFGIALVEAMAAGRACITSNRVGIADEIQHRHAGLITSCGDVPSLAAAIIQLLADQRMRADLGAGAARLAAERFSLSVMGAALAKAYTQITQMNAVNLTAENQQGPLTPPA